MIKTSCEKKVVYNSLEIGDYFKLNGNGNGPTYCKGSENTGTRGWNYIKVLDDTVVIVTVERWWHPKVLVTNIYAYLLIIFIGCVILPVVCCYDIIRDHFE